MHRRFGESGYVDVEALKERLPEIGPVQRRRYLQYG